MVFTEIKLTFAGGIEKTIWGKGEVSTEEFSQLFRENKSLWLPNYEDIHNPKPFYIQLENLLFAEVVSVKNLSSNDEEKS